MGGTTAHWRSGGIESGADTIW